MDTEAPRKPWYRRTKYILLLAMLVALLVLSLFPYLPLRGPKSADQRALDQTVDYFASNYNATTGLIPETPGSHTFWLYPDNYLAQLAISRYDPRNQSTVAFASALSVAMGGYTATMPPGLLLSQYTALNSTFASFNCHENVTLGWGPGGSPTAGEPSAVLRSTVNDGSPTCQTQNYADLLFLQAVFFHRLGNSTEGLSALSLAKADFDGKGIVDLAGPSSPATGTYQTYKLALYVFASACLGQATSDQNVPTAEGILFRMQDNSTGGFYSGYDSSFSHGSTTVNTETTALAALAIESLISPANACGA